MTNELLTPSEKLAMHRTTELWSVLQEVVGNDISREGDLRELCQAIHVIQRAIMAQAAARAYPTEFRLLGEVIRKKEV